MTTWTCVVAATTTVVATVGALATLTLLARWVREPEGVDVGLELVATRLVSSSTSSYVDATNVVDRVI